jgi:hypothetical protein
MNESGFRFFSPGPLANCSAISKLNFTNCSSCLGDLGLREDIGIYRDYHVKRVRQPFDAWRVIGIR